MKRLITAILPLILIAQIPFHAASYLPSEWLKSVQYGMKWTELMLNGYPGIAEAQEAVPEGEVTTTVILASAIPEYEHLMMPLDPEFCEDEMREQMERAREEAREILVQLEEDGVLQIRTARSF